MAITGPMLGHTAVVTGANHGIGAATAEALARRGCGVLCCYLRIEDPVDAAVPQACRDHRAQDAAEIFARIRAGGGQAGAVEADLSDPAAPAALFDAAEQQLGPVDILVNNATGWVQDTFTPSAGDQFGRSLRPVTAAPWDQQFRVDAMAAAASPTILRVSVLRARFAAGKGAAGAGYPAPHQQPLPARGGRLIPEERQSEQVLIPQT